MIYHKPVDYKLLCRGYKAFLDTRNFNHQLFSGILKIKCAEMKSYEYGKGLKIILDGTRKLTTVIFENNPFMDAAASLSVGDEVYTRGYIQPGGFLIILTQRFEKI